jgi:hypothetical protein
MPVTEPPGVFEPLRAAALWPAWRRVITCGTRLALSEPRIGGVIVASTNCLCGALFMSLATACGGGGGVDLADGTSDLTSKMKEGSVCGYAGAAAQGKDAITGKCPSGMTCSNEGNDDDTMTCQAQAAGSEAKLGEACGDDVAIRKKCAAGLTCVPPGSGPISEHTPGTCQRRALEGQDCKSFGNPTLPECAPGLTCEPGPVPDSAHCVK